MIWPTIITSFFAYAPVWLWVSAAITVLHTCEEVDGEIWKTLSVPWWLYGVFQLFVLLLGSFVILSGELIWLFVTIRILDTVITHWILCKPGIWTSPLLVFDAITIVILGSGTAK